MADNNNLLGSTAAVAVTAAILSPHMRGLLRKGAVQGLAGVLIAGDAVSSFARGVGRGLQSGDAPPQPGASSMATAQEAARAAQEAENAAEAAPAAAATPRKRPRARKSAAARQASTTVTEGEP